jgi:hypothetical protein
MNARKILSVVAFVAILVVLYLFWTRTKHEPIAVAPSPKSAAQPSAPQSTASSPPKDAQGRLLPVASPGATPGKESRETSPEAVKRFMGAYLASISFYGKVVDERGNPIEGAVAKLVAVDRPFSDGTSYEKTSDAQGLFSITGIHGAGLVVSVTKAGYYRTDQSTGSVSYGKLPTSDERAIPKPEAPAIFVLRKMGESVPLVHLESKGVRIVEDGTPVEVDLATGAQNRGGSETVRVEVWSDNPTYGAQGPYGWKARVSVPGGGLIERTGEFDFEAPADGYVPTFETSMAQNAERWRNGFERQFFARLSDGHFARFTINLKTGGLFFTLESFLNPTPGNRNLEFDPQKAVVSPTR